MEYALNNFLYSFFKITFFESKIRLEVIFFVFIKLKKAEILLFQPF